MAHLALHFTMTLVNSNSFNLCLLALVPLNLNT